MIPDLAGLHPVWQALLAGGFTWGMTAAGAGLVFLCGGRAASKRPPALPSHG